MSAEPQGEPDCGWAKLELNRSGWGKVWCDGWTAVAKEHLRASALDMLLPDKTSDIDEKVPSPLMQELWAFPALVPCVIGRTISRPDPILPRITEVTMGDDYLGPPVWVDADRLAWVLSVLPSPVECRTTDEGRYVVLQTSSRRPERLAMLAAVRLDPEEPA